MNVFLLDLEKQKILELKIRFKQRCARMEQSEIRIQVKFDNPIQKRFDEIRRVSFSLINVLCLNSTLNIKNH